MPTRADLHVHTRFSTDSGNFALRRARLGESYTDPERAYRVAKQRGMRFVTISDHNTVAGALRIAHHEDAFLSVEVTTRFPEDDLPLHVLVWNLSEEDHRDLQPYRSSVYELQAFLAERRLLHGLAHPLYRMGPPITVSHVERMMLLFGTWEGRNGGRPREHNDTACRLARWVSPGYLEKLAERHELAPRHGGCITLVGGSDDHGALDIATTWTDVEAEAGSVEELLAAIARGDAVARGAHGSAEKLAHAIMALFGNAYRESGGALAAPLDSLVAHLFDTDADDPESRHREITDSGGAITRWLGERAREGGLELDSIPDLGARLARLAFAAAVQLPFLATAHHHAGARRDLRRLQEEFYGEAISSREPRALIFTDTITETNGVAGTMRRLAGLHDARIGVVSASTGAVPEGTHALVPEWSLPLPTSEHIDLHFPNLLEVLRLVQELEPDVIQLATPGPVGLCGLVVAKLVGLPVIGSYHTELGPYALHLTRDLVVAEAIGMYVDWFYGRCDATLAPTTTVAERLVERGVCARELIWARGVDGELFRPDRRDSARRSSLYGDAELVLLSVGRVSAEKRLDVLLEAYRRLASIRQVVLAIVGDGPERQTLEREAPSGTLFLGELQGDELADAYANADVFCFPSTTDTFGQVLLEAGASGLPVVAAATGGALDLVRPGMTGVLVDPDDPVRLAEALESLADAPALRRSLGKAGRDAALERTWERSFEQLREAHRALLGRERTPSRNGSVTRSLT
ncbi:MAG: glycosyltransferase [Gaiella sp.]